MNFLSKILLTKKYAIKNVYDFLRKNFSKKLLKIFNKKRGQMLILCNAS